MVSLRAFPSDDAAEADSLSDEEQAALEPPPVGLRAEAERRVVRRGGFFAERHEQPRPAAPLAILCEPHGTTGEILKAVIRKQGYDLIWVKDGRTGVKLTIKSKPTLVLFDLASPRSDGVGLLSQLAVRHEVDATWRVALTSLHEEIRPDVLEIGADEVLFKPLDLDRVSTLLKRLKRSSRTGKSGFGVAT